MGIFSVSGVGPVLLISEWTGGLMSCLICSRAISTPYLPTWPYQFGVNCYQIEGCVSHHWVCLCHFAWTLCQCARTILGHSWGSWTELCHQRVLELKSVCHCARWHRTVWNDGSVLFILHVMALRLWVLPYLCIVFKTVYSLDRLSFVMVYTMCSLLTYFIWL